LKELNEVMGGDGEDTRPIIEEEMFDQFDQSDSKVTQQLSPHTGKGSGNLLVSPQQ
jgi:hypothetical protein